MKLSYVASKVFFFLFVSVISQSITQRNCILESDRTSWILLKPIEDFNLFNNNVTVIVADVIGSKKAAAQVASEVKSLQIYDN